MLSNTVCNAAEAEASTERVLNALRRVGVKDEAEDETMNEALEVVMKAVNDIIYKIFGANGFSDWPKNNFVIPSITP